MEKNILKKPFRKNVEYLVETNHVRDVIHGMSQDSRERCRKPRDSRDRDKLCETFSRKKNKNLDDFSRDGMCLKRARSDSHYSRFATFEGLARPLFFKLKKEGFAISNDSQL